MLASKGLALTLIVLAATTSACRRSIPEPTTPEPAATTNTELAKLAAERGAQRYLVPISDADLSRGASDALVTIVLWFDYQPRDAALLQQLEAEVDAHPDELRLVVKFRPSRPEGWGARAILAAHAQGRGWELLGEMIATAQREELGETIEQARVAGVPDIERFERERRVDPHPELARQLELAARLGVRRTPVMFVNGAVYGELVGEGRLAEVLSSELELARELVAAGAKPGEVYSLLVAHAAAEREVSADAELFVAPFDALALATRTLDRGIVVEDLELGRGDPLGEGKIAEFWFSAYSEASGDKVMGSRDEPATMSIDPAAPEGDPIAAAIARALVGMQPGGKRRIRIPAAIVEQAAPAGRTDLGDLRLAVELVGIHDAPPPEVEHD